MNSNSEWEQDQCINEVLELQPWQINELTFHPLKDTCEKMLLAIKKLDEIRNKYRQRCQYLECELQEWVQENQHLNQHTNILQEECGSLRDMVTELQLEKERKLKQFSFSETQLKNTCLEISMELQSQKNRNFELINAQKFMMRKIKELEVLQEKFSRKKKTDYEIEQIQHENIALKKELTSAKKRQQSLQIDFDMMREQNLRLKQQVFEIEQKLQEYKEQYNFFINNHHHIKTEQFSLEEGQNKAIPQCYNEDDFQRSKHYQRSSENNIKDIQVRRDSILTLLSRNNSQKSLMRERRSFLGGQSKFRQEKFIQEQPNSENSKDLLFSSQQKKSERQILQNSQSNNRSSQYSFMQGLVIQNKYQKEIKKLRKQYSKLRQQYTQLQYEKMIKMDNITQLQGQLQMKDDEYRQLIEDMKTQLGIQKKKHKQIRSQMYSQKLQSTHRYNQLQILYSQTKQENTKYKQSMREMQNKYAQHIKTIVHNYEEEIKIYMEAIHNHKHNKHKQIHNHSMTISNVFSTNIIHKVQKYSIQCQTPQQCAQHTYTQPQQIPQQQPSILLGQLIQSVYYQDIKQAQIQTQTMCALSQVGCQYSSQQTQNTKEIGVGQHTQYQHQSIMTNHTPQSQLQQTQTQTQTQEQVQTLQRCTQTQLPYQQLSSSELSSIYNNNNNNNNGERDIFSSEDIINEILQLPQRQNKVQLFNQHYRQSSAVQQDKENNPNYANMHTHNTHKATLKNKFSGQENSFLNNYLDSKKSYTFQQASSINFNFDKQFWQHNKLYECQSKILQTNTSDTILFWSTGLVSLSLKKGIQMKKKKRRITEKHMNMLGNCEIRVQGKNIKCNRSNKANYYEGDLPDYTWEIIKVNTYKID